MFAVPRSLLPLGVIGRRFWCDCGSSDYFIYYLIPVLLDIRIFKTVGTLGLSLMCYLPWFVFYFH